METAIPALNAQKVCKRYRFAQTNALNNFTLQVRQGEFFGLLGINGAGKTTAVSIFSGLSKPTTGTVALFGKDVSRETTAVKRSIGLVPQNIALYDKLTGIENLRFFGKLHGLSGQKLRGAIDYCLAFSGLESRANDPVATYSGGMKRRLNLAAGLIHTPQMLILDEPTVGVDTQSRHLIHEDLQRLNRDGMTIIFTGHYMEEMEKLCSRIAIMDRGAVLLDGTPQELLADSPSRNLEELFLSLTTAPPEQEPAL